MNNSFLFDLNKVLMSLDAPVEKRRFRNSDGESMMMIKRPPHCLQNKEIDEWTKRLYVVACNELKEKPVDIVFTRGRDLLNDLLLMTYVMFEKGAIEEYCSKFQKYFNGISQ